MRADAGSPFTPIRCDDSAALVVSSAASSTVAMRSASWKDDSALNSSVASSSM